MNPNFPDGLQGVENSLKFVSAMAEQLEGGHALLIATHDLAVDQARPDLKVVHGLHDEWVAVRRIVAPTGDKPDAHRVPRAMSRKPSCLIS